MDNSQKLTVLDVIRRDKSVTDLLQGFEKAVGIKVALMDSGPLFHEGVKETVQDHLFCRQFVKSGEDALNHCVNIHARSREGTNEPVHCDAGLLHSAIPISVQGEVVGFLTVFGVATNPQTLAPIRKVLLRKNGLRINGEKPVLFHLLETLERHPESRIDGAMLLLKAVAVSIEQHAKNSILPQRNVILPVRLFRAMEFAKAHYTDHLSLRKVAAEVGVTPQQLAKLFRNTLKVTFTWWLADFRVSKAKIELRALRLKRILDISMQCGFGTVSSFNRSFRAITGLTPGEYRAGHELRQPGKYLKTMKRKKSGNPGFTLLEVMMSLLVIVLTAASVYWSYMQINQYAAATRLSTAATMLVQKQIDLIQSDGPFIPQGASHSVPAELALGTSTQTAVPIYTDPLSGGVVVSGSLTTTVTDISNTAANQYAYRATVMLSYNYRGTPYQTIMSTIKGSDQ